MVNSPAPENQDGKNKGGRPTLLNNDLILKAREYEAIINNAGGKLTCLARLDRASTLIWH